MILEVARSENRGVRLIREAGPGVFVNSSWQTLDYESGTFWLSPQLCNLPASHGGMCSHNKAETIITPSNNFSLIGGELIWVDRGHEEGVNLQQLTVWDSPLSPGRLAVHWVLIFHCRHVWWPY